MQRRMYRLSYSCKEVLYNHKADLHGTGNRSILD